MATRVSKVLEEALALTPEQRLDLAAWRTELDERIHEVETGVEQPVPWAQARARLRARLADG
jgi:hypothetical protein